MAYQTITRDNCQLDPNTFIIVTPVSATIAEQTVINFNCKIYSLVLNLVSGSSQTVTIKNGNGKKLIDAVPVAAGQPQVILIDQVNGFRMENGIVISSDADDAVVVWMNVKQNF